MGSFLDKPKTDKTTKIDAGNGLRAVVTDMQGWRVDMEDAHTVCMSVPGHPEYAWFAVFDGHGGSLVSRTAAERLLGKITATPEWRDAGHGADETLDTELLTRALKKGFLELDEELRRLPEVDRGDDHSGSTAVAALVTPKHVICANCGDSRSVMVQASGVVAMSDDHKPYLEGEQRRIEAAGGTVTMRRVNGDLAVSRALGDFVYKHMREMRAEEQQVSAEPEIRIHVRQAEDEMLVLACDGIWDVVTNEEMGTYIRDRLAEVGSDAGLSTVAEKMLDDCLERNSRDNMSVVLVDMKPASRSAPPERAGAAAVGAAAAAGGASGGAGSDLPAEQPVPQLGTPAPFAAASSGGGGGGGGAHGGEDVEMDTKA